MWFICKVNDGGWRDPCWPDGENAAVPVAVLGLLRKPASSAVFVCCSIWIVLPFVIDALCTLHSGRRPHFPLREDKVELWTLMEKFSTLAFSALLYTTVRWRWPFGGSEGLGALGLHFGGSHWSTIPPHYCCTAVIIYTEGVLAGWDSYRVTACIKKHNIKSVVNLLESSLGWQVGCFPRTEENLWGLIWSQRKIIEVIVWEYGCWTTKNESLKFPVSVNSD